MIVEYYVTNDTIHAFARPDAGSPDVSCVRTSCSYLSLLEMTRRFRRQAEAEAELTDAEALYGVLIAPLRDAGILNDGEPLAIAPHRCLHSIPFAGLRNGSADLLDRHPITYAPSSAFMKQLGSRADLSAGCVVVERAADKDNDGLRASFAREAACVAASTGGVLLADDEATIGRVAEAVRGCSVVHFTCHGTFDSDDPGQSGLLLAGEDGGDQLCTIEQIARMPFDVDLVVLAACETALSERHPGDELLGLLRAFTLAGAKSVLATLWPVHTISTEIAMKTFYEALLTGERPRDALRAAQCEVRKEQVYAHPYHWAPFILMAGDQ